MPSPLASPDLAELATFHGVATSYQDSEHQDVLVDPAIVVAVLGMLGVEAGTDAEVHQSLEQARLRASRNELPPTIVVLEGSTRTLEVAARLVQEDGTACDVEAVPDDLPLGYHRLVTDQQDVALLVVPARMPEVPLTWGWMLQLYSLHSDRSWGMGDFGDLREMVRRSGTEQGAGVVLVNPVQAVSPVHPIQRSPYSPASRRFANPLYLRVADTRAYAAADADVRATVDALMPPMADLIDHDAVWDAKREAFELLWPHRPEQERIDGDADVEAFGTFCALAEQHGGDWRDWPHSLHDPGSEDVARARTDAADRVAFHVWLQHLCREQLDAARD
ncbi:MAG: malQ, partial [Aeromicrobium sp.]|nr:malQ [Aeromicrobium sp.]